MTVHIGHRIQDLRREKARRVGGYTQAQLAEELGVAEATVTAWECNYRPPPEEKLPRIARALGVAVEDLVAPEGPSLTPDLVEAFLATISGPHARERQLDALEGFRRAFAARGEVPAWWWEVKSFLEHSPDEN